MKEIKLTEVVIDNKDNLDQKQLAVSLRILVRRELEKDWKVDLDKNSFVITESHFAYDLKYVICDVAIYENNFMEVK